MKDEVGKVGVEERLGDGCLVTNVKFSLSALAHSRPFSSIRTGGTDSTRVLRTCGPSPYMYPSQPSRNKEEPFYYWRRVRVQYYYILLFNGTCSSRDGKGKPTSSVRPHGE